MADSNLSRIGPAEPGELVWIDCPYPIASVGLARVLQGKVQVHVGKQPPREEPSVAIFGIGGVEGLSEGMKRIRRRSSGVPILVFGLHLDLPVARAALCGGARGFIHAGMTSKEMGRAVEVALSGEMVAPREMLEYLIAKEESVDLDVLSARQREVVELVGEGLTNAQIAKKLFLTEGTVKQHLRTAYRLLGVSNRVEAAKLVRLGAA